jgi:hypothetical protein
VTTFSPSDLLSNTNSLLAILAIALLVFVSLGVVYLSSVEWRDRRRRRALEKTARP